MPFPVICTTLLIEKSPQALPLGAACIASAVKNYGPVKDFIDVKLKAFSLEDSDIKKLSDDKAVAVFIADELYKIAGDLCNGECDNFFVCFSCFVWNVQILRQAALILQKKGAVCIAGGPEITAHPDFYKDFDFTPVVLDGKDSWTRYKARILELKESINIITFCKVLNNKMF